MITLQNDVNDVSEEAQQQVLVGLYDATTQVRLPVFSDAGQLVGDSWRVVSPVHEE